MTWLPSPLDSPRNIAVSILSSGFPVTLTCSSDANPPVRTYTWYQGAACLPTADKSFYQGIRSRVDTVRDQTFSSANFTTDRDGKHCCVARNKHGAQTSVVSLGGSSGRFIKIHIICTFMSAPQSCSQMIPNSTNDCECVQVSYYICRY